MDNNQLALVRSAVLASCRAYSIGQLPPDQELPDFGGFGFVGKLAEFVSGDKDMDAAFVAKTKDATVVAFRGTLPPTAHPQSFTEFVTISRDWMNDGVAELVTRAAYTGKVHLGFSKSLQGLIDQGLIDEVKKQAADGKPVIITGHSKGGHWRHWLQYDSVQKELATSKRRHLVHHERETAILRPTTANRSRII